MSDYTLNIFSGLAVLFVFVIGVGLLWVAGMYFTDKRQKSHAIRRNYPVIGRFRYLFEHLGEFFRQYFFAMDREELPFNRAERGWAYRAAKNLDTNLAFGSTLDLSKPGSYLFMNAGFPVQDEDALLPAPVTVGPFCREPYTTRSLINISAMSFGALSRPAVEALSAGAAQAGCWLNTGEGGLSPYHLSGGADIVMQIGTAKYGVRNDDGSLDFDKLKALGENPQIKMFEIKLSQGAKPGKGGILPAEKVTAEIAEIRGIPQGQASISPNGHHDIHNVTELLDRINEIREVTGKPVGFKFVMGEQRWINDLLVEIGQRGLAQAPDFITLDSATGGSGAAPQPLLDYMGLPINESLPWLVDQLEARGLRDRIKVIASGKLITPAKIAWALASGADFINTARGFMFSLGCIQAMQCNKNTCPTGVTTHNKELQYGLVPADKAQRVAQYHANTSHAVAVLAHSCGVPEPRQLRREHVRVVMANSLSMPLSELHPTPLRWVDPGKSKNVHEAQERSSEL